MASPNTGRNCVFVPFNLAQPTLVDDQNFAIDNHVFCHSLADDASLDDAFALAMELAAKPLNREAPLWAMHFITGLGSTLLVHVSHLALLDGMSIGEDAHIFFDLHREPATLEAKPWVAQPEPSGMELIAAAIQENSSAFGERANRVQNLQGNSTELVRRATESITRFLTEPVCSPPWNRGFVGTERLFQQISVPYLQIRRIRRKFSGTDNDVVLAVLAEAAACYLQNKGLDYTGEHLRVMCPVKVRREDQHGVRGSRISGIFPFLKAEPQGISARLEQVRWETESIKQNREAQSLQLMSELAPPLPPMPDATGMSMPGMTTALNSTLNLMTFNPVRFFQQFMPQQVHLPGQDLMNNMAGFNFTCLTARGAQTSLFFQGCEVKAQYLVPPLAANLGFGVAVSTYAQTLTFNLVADAQLLPDLADLARGIGAQISELKELSGTQAA